MNEITVLTATYNRRDLLVNLFKSLVSQTNHNFTWVVVDDGSDDDTEVYIESLIKKSPFIIRYFKKENGGKHTALNYAYKYIDTPLTFIVDSDDWLATDAISTIYETCKCYKEIPDICGFSFLRGKPNGEYLSSSGVPKNGLIESFVECRINRNISGDMAEVWYTDCLKEYPFPEFEGEKFLGEDVVWVRMSARYKLIYFNKVIYISDYREDGLTNNRRRHNISSPRGCVERAKTFLRSNSCMRIKIKSMLQYQIYGKFAEISNERLWKESNNKLLYLVCLIPARILYFKWKMEAK